MSAKPGLRNVLPRPLWWPLLLVLGLALWIGVVERDVVGAAVVVGTVGVVATILLAADAAGRRRLRRRRAQMPAGSGVWRGYVDALDPAGLELLGADSAWTLLTGEAVAVDVVVTPTSMRAVPTWRGRLARYRPVVLRWDEVAAVEVGERIWELGTRPRLSPLIPVRLLVVGEQVGELYRALSDAEAREEGWTAQERAELDAELLADARAEHGGQYRLGTMPFTVLVSGSDGLAPLLTRYARGALPS